MLTFETARELFNYNKTTGVLTWKPRHVSHFNNEVDAKRWNSRFAGKPAFTTISNRGMVGKVQGVRYLAHRVVWLHVYGSWPTEVLRHKNGNKSDNRTCNLIEITASEARVLPGHGVYKETRSGRWVAVLGRQYLGSFKYKKRAVQCRAKAEREIKERYS